MSNAGGSLIQRSLKGRPPSQTMIYLRSWCYCAWAVTPRALDRCHWLACMSKNRQKKMWLRTMLSDTAIRMLTRYPKTTWLPIVGESLTGIQSLLEAAFRRLSRTWSEAIDELEYTVQTCIQMMIKRNCCEYRSRLQRKVVIPIHNVVVGNTSEKINIKRAARLVKIPVSFAPI